MFWVRLTYRNNITNSKYLLIDTCDLILFSYLNALLLSICVVFVAFALLLLPLIAFASTPPSPSILYDYMV